MRKGLIIGCLIALARSLFLHEDAGIWIGSSEGRCLGSSISFCDYGHCVFITFADWRVIGLHQGFLHGSCLEPIELRFLQTTDVWMTVRASSVHGMSSIFFTDCRAIARGVPKQLRAKTKKTVAGLKNTRGKILRKEITNSVQEPWMPVELLNAERGCGWNRRQCDDRLFCWFQYPIAEQ